MLQSVSLSNYPITNTSFGILKKKVEKPVSNPVQNSQPIQSKVVSQGVVQTRTVLNEAEKKKYNALVSKLANAQSKNSNGLKPTQQLDVLLKNGKLLSKSQHDNSTTLDNLYNIATIKRANGLDSTILLTDTLDTLVNPRFITQTFGDIPNELKPAIAQSLSKDNPVKQDYEQMNVYSSGTCAAASLEVNMADKLPAEFARWVSDLSSEKMQVDLNVKLSALTQNPLDSLMLLRLLEAQKISSDFNSAKIKVDLDEGAHIRACVQTRYWNPGERNVADVLIHSAIMKLGSQNTYNSLNDVREGKYSANPQGLVEIEKTFVESLIKNKEITSITYQYIDSDQNLADYYCTPEQTQKHIMYAIDSGDNVILGYVETNQSSGLINSPEYDASIHGGPNKVINGHEITVVDYYKDEKGEVIFVCIDTDDNSPDLIQYSSSFLIPRIHHAGYPAHLVEEDSKEILKKISAVE